MHWVQSQELHEEARINLSLFRKLIKDGRE
jgi:hypothetical protein